MNGDTTVLKVTPHANTNIPSLMVLGEYQPVYEEFSSMVLLVLAFVHRYDLTYNDLGIGHESFVARLLERGHCSMSPDQMTEDQGQQLGNWLRGLFDADKEGLSNDVLASCRPQDFYLIVPTLFSQTVMACSAEVLSLDSVKGGLECKLTGGRIQGTGMLTGFQISMKLSFCHRL